MTSPSPTPAPKPRRPFWRNIPWIVLGGIILGLAFLYVRGTWASGEPINPASVEQGPVSQVYLDPEHGRTVRAAILLPHPPKKVWALVTNYGRYDGLFGHLKGVTADGTALRGQARSAFGGWWDFAIVMTEAKDGTTWRATWDQPGGSLRVNRGGWTVSPAGDGKTLLTLSLEAQVEEYPTFFIRNAFLGRLPQALAAVAAELDARK